MLKTFKYRLYPTKKQTTKMLQTLDECRWLYNHFLEQRKITYEEKQESLNYHKQAASIVGMKHTREAFNNIHSQVLQNVAIRIDLAFKAFFRRVKAGEKPGYPRFKSQDRYDSFTYPQSGFEITDRGIKLSKIGTVKTKLHRETAGKIKTCNIRKAITGKWYVTLSCEVEADVLPISTSATGIDVGLETFATLSLGEKIDNPRFFRKSEKDLAKVQRRLSKAIKGTPERKKKRKAVAKVHEKISNRRNNFCHQESRKIVNQYGTICIEDLSINKMVHNHCLSKSIHDAAWNQFTQYLSYKAECAGRKLIRVNPAYTSQTCNRCGHRESKKLSDRIHRCKCCGFEICRDHNAALNILALGMQSLSL